MKQIIITLCICFSISLQSLFGEKLIVATYNVRNHNYNDSIMGNGWYRRCPLICDQIRFYDFEIFGAQEVLYDQLKDMLHQLPEYGYVGVGRDDGNKKGEFAPIFYKKKQFKLLSSGNFWLSDITYEPNRGWDAALPRICTWAKLKDLKSGFSFFFFNLHMDHIGVDARKNSAKLVLNKIDEISDGLPVILTGDFNVDQHSPNYEILEGSKVLTDSYLEADVCYALNGTFNDFKTNTFTDSRIDHIFVSLDFKVERYGVLTDTYRSKLYNEHELKSSNFPKEVSMQKYEARALSDHFPIMVILNY
ncbi:endonuclease/exonuclease/phosphatase family protein [Plebeiibacterium sediminum]|uniref:Endonuclease/exonuclease/phosphatase family protein n=1 Tax=Plebeiibacterium sediminum TaxID=2992112 RepID=A0AAE3M6G2_9BACT|nr:endonuclease/exonuclease/phosphatase family protein [Plebeiobacterium sediminum]MCW3787958.1 endonuclease/exonuclease/phosphatase family protein [Plebeiobacterium sediminum]